MIDLHFLRISFFLTSLQRVPFQQIHYSLFASFTVFFLATSPPHVLLESQPPSRSLPPPTPCFRIFTGDIDHPIVDSSLEVGPMIMTPLVPGHGVLQEWRNLPR
ncbi:hypothetical protein FRB95_001100 [Tulasnella sp. JGI-2019a]|nr:hypothetical protein FRB93_010393 [Tulasnella sp. JGI-2019a]KAG9032672.1 hypothetical protein FRB95_001100 [Tulasnella sp. JGI-2019a]